jgi:hypothetical protein
MPHEQETGIAVTLTRVACGLVIALMLAALAYVTVTAISQYGNIGV